MTENITAQDLRPGMTVQVVGLSPIDSAFGSWATQHGQNVMVDCGTFRKSSPVVTVESVELVERHRSGRTGFGTYRITTTAGQVFTMSNRQKARVTP